MMNSSSVTPPHRISREAWVAPVCFFITYGVVRARGRVATAYRGVDVHHQRDEQPDPDHPEEPV